MKFVFDWWKIRTGFYFRIMRNEVITGYSSRCSDGKHVILLDYDGLPRLQVVQELRALQEMYDLGDFFLFGTGKGFHAVCCTKVSLVEYKWVVSDACCDRNQWLIPLLHGKKTVNLRSSAKGGKKPFFIGMIVSAFGVGRLQSLAHLNLLKGLGVNNLVVPVNSEKLLMCTYKV